MLHSNGGAGGTAEDTQRLTARYADSEMSWIRGIPETAPWLYVMHPDLDAMTEEALEMNTLTTPDETTATLAYRLTAADRCDSCGAQAYIAAEVNGSELLFCAHHGRKYEEKLRSVATSWHDETPRLSEPA